MSDTKGFQVPKQVMLASPSPLFLFLINFLNICLNFSLAVSAIWVLSFALFITLLNCSVRECKSHCRGLWKVIKQFPV